MSYVTSIDVSAIQTLSEVINAHTSRCVYVCLIKVRRPVLSMMHLSQLVETTQYLKYYGKISECVYDLKARGVLDEDGV